MITKPLVLFGKRGSGKDTVGNLIRYSYPGFELDSFAAPIKQIAKLAFPAFTDEDLYGESSRRETLYSQYPFPGKCLRCDADCTTAFVSKLGPSSLECRACNIQYPAVLNPRIVLQTAGTEWGRRLYENVWIDALFARAAQRANELTLERGTEYGKLAAVTRQARTVVTDGRFYNEHERAKELGAFTIKLLRNFDTKTSGHKSETEIETIPDSSFSYILDNRGTLEELPALVEAMLVHLYH
jgi:hypothetical protein